VTIITIAALTEFGAPPPAGRRRPGPPRKGPARDEEYKAWIRTLACCACGIPGRSEAAHTPERMGESR